MERRFLDTTVVYDVHGQMYLQAELYGSGDPAETIEMRILEPGQVALGEGCRGGGDRQRAGACWETAETIEEPFLLEERHIKATSSSRRCRRRTRILPCALADDQARSGPKMVVLDSPADTLDNADSGAPRGRSTHTLDGLPLRNDE